MKPITPELEAYFASNRELIYADAYTVELVGGTDDNYRLRWTTAPQDLVVDPLAGPPGKVTYLANVTGISGLRAKQSIGMEVDEQELVLTPSKGPRHPGRGRAGSYLVGRAGRGLRPP
jgi:hypothetical protein